jgi:hypothetical protein
MTDIIDRLTHEIDYAQGILIEDALCAMEDARDEIQRLRGELENVQRDRMAHAEVERLRAERDAAQVECFRVREHIAEWHDARETLELLTPARGFSESQRARAGERLQDAEDALTKEANR